MLASRLPGILPPLTEEEALEVAAVRSVCGLPLSEHWGRRPFRAPHHTAQRRGPGGRWLLAASR
nr:ATP-binding protein [Halomonas sp. BC04]